MNIFLVGFMGCGKSTIGKKLANKLKYNFVDSDSYLENQEGMSVDRIFSTQGEDYFRQLEFEFLKNLKSENTIYALGGGTPCAQERMDAIKAKGKLIYIDMPAEALRDRLQNSKKSRPLIDALKNDKSKLLEFIENLLEERKPFYSQADVTISGINLSSERLDLIVQMLTY